MMGRKCFSLHYRALRQSLERLDKKFCNDPHWMAAAVEATGIPAVEVRACCRSRSLLLAPPHAGAGGVQARPLNWQTLYPTLPH